MEESKNSNTERPEAHADQETTATLSWAWDDQDRQSTTSSDDDHDSENSDNSDLRRLNAEVDDYFEQMERQYRQELEREMDEAYEATMKEYFAKMEQDNQEQTLEDRHVSRLEAQRRARQHGPIEWLPPRTPDMSNDDCRNDENQPASTTMASLNATIDQVTRRYRDEFNL